MEIIHESFKNVDIFTLSGNLSSEHEDNLKLLLMKVVHSMGRSVLNLRGIDGINSNSLKLLNKAYRTSVRLKNPIIITEVPEPYITEIFSDGSINSSRFQLENDETVADEVMSGAN
jgi:anti-anti-sigma regulatory factor